MDHAPPLLQPASDGSPYIYMDTHGSELSRLVGEDAMRQRYKAAAWEYQDAVWTPLVRLIAGGNATWAWSPDEAQQKAAAFADALQDRARTHGAEYKIPDADLREQIKAAAVRVVCGAYTGFVKANAGALADARRDHLPVDVVEGMVTRVFDEMGDGVAGSVGRARSRRRESRESTNLRVGLDEFW